MKLAEMQALEVRRLLAANLVADVGGIYPTDSVTINGVSYFAAADATHGKELWRSDGTHGGTWMIEDLVAGASSSNPTYLAAIGNKALFFSRRGTNLGLFVSDGTAAGTGRLSIVSQINLDIAPVVFQNKLFFVTGLVTQEPLKLWSSDGTIAGTKIISTLGEGYANGGKLTVLGNRLIINAALRLWSTDGTTAGTVALSNIDNPAMLRSATSVAYVNGKGIIIGSREDDVEIWQTDGTLQGTRLLRTYANSGTVGLTFTSGSRTFFSRWDAASDTHRAMITDGTVAGTRELMTVRRFNGATVLDNGRFAFVTHDESETRHLWVSDGTPAGTSEIQSFANFGDGYGVQFNTVAGTTFFILRNDSGVQQLWRTDGSVAGTAQVEDLAARGAVNVNVTLTNVDNKLAVTFAGQTLVFDAATMGVPVGPLTNSITITDRVMRVFGTRDADIIRIYRHPTQPQRFVVNINGLSRSFAASSVRKIVVYSYSGDDTVEMYERFGAIAIRSMISTGDGNDTITGSSYPDSIYGEGGDDSIFAGGNADVVSGGNGDDQIEGGSGNDVLRGDAGADSVFGGSGRDIISGGADAGADRLDGGSGEDVIFGTAVFEIFYNGQQSQLDPLDELVFG